MPSKILSGALIGLEAQGIDVEVDVAPGLPNFMIVGLPDTSVQEARVRVKSAIRNSGLPFPRTRVTVNLAPADLKKEGSVYDLPIALGVLVAEEYLDDPAWFSETVWIGELALNGTLRKVSGVLSIAIMAKRMGKKILILPSDNAREAAIISDLKIYPARSLAEVVRYLQGSICFLPARFVSSYSSETKIGRDEWASIRGQDYAKRAIEIAVAGHHHLLMVGPPGAGKTMLARAAHALLPPLSSKEAIEVTQIYSVAGLLSSSFPLMTDRPFRSPHSGASPAAVIGGGKIPRPGEISLAHRGILFLDEFAEFPRNVLEALRGPLDEGRIVVSRVHGSLTFPAKFMLIAAANPCPCGFFRDSRESCRCGPREVFQYQKKISGPIADRLDLHVEVPRLEIQDLRGSIEVHDSLAQRLERVLRAYEIQRDRFSDHPITIMNSEILPRDLSRYCPLGLEEENFLHEAVREFHLSARGYHKILKISRTIADLDGEAKIQLPHLAEALQYRTSRFGEEGG